MDLNGKRVVIVGLGKSGIAAAKLCKRLGANVLGVDDASAERLGRSLQGLDIELKLAGYSGVDFVGADVVVLSPGVPPFAELDALRQRGTEVIAELELAARHCSVPIIAVGGTNGKSTTTNLIGLLFEAAQREVFVGGNYGVPACDAVGGDAKLWVLEVSSFQLEAAPTFKPRASVLLNITDDHLDRYADREAYAQAKGNAFVNQTREDIAVYPHGDALCLGQVQRGRGRPVSYGGGGDYSVRDGLIIEVNTGESFSLEGAELHGAHSHHNAAAAVAVGRAFELEREHIEEGLARFRPLPHRMDLIGRSQGVTFYDDSKATNVGAAVTALRGLSESKAVLIAGGRDKGGTYEPLVQALIEKGRALVVVGEARERIKKAVAGRLHIEQATSIPEATERAFALARAGDAVLLSPACSSLDMFASYAERGDSFIAATQRIIERCREERA